MRSAKQIQNIKDGVHKAQQEFKEKGKYIGRNVPYGYKIKDRDLYIDNETSHIVFLIFDLFDKGCTYTQISNYLNSHNISSPVTYKKTANYLNDDKNNIYGSWTRKTIERIIKNRVYAGYYHYSDIITHSAIIPAELFNSIQNRIVEKKNTTQSDFYYQNGNEFSSKVYCMDCGKGFNLFNCNNKDGLTRYLRCGSLDTRREHKVDCPNKLAIRYDNLKDIVSIYIESNIYEKFDDKVLNEEYINILNQSLLSIRRKYLKQEKKLLNSKLDDLKKPITDNNDLIDQMNLNSYNNYKKLYNDRLKELELLQKELISFGRTKDTSKNQFIDRYIIDTFIDKIYIGHLENNNRKINIVLK